jgi:hypothetical protein
MIADRPMTDANILSVGLAIETLDAQLFKSLASGRFGGMGCHPPTFQRAIRKIDLYA